MPLSISTPLHFCQLVVGSMRARTVEKFPANAFFRSRPLRPTSDQLVVEYVAVHSLAAVWAASSRFGWSGAPPIVLKPVIPGHMVCIIHTTQSRELIKLLLADGWQLQRTRGSHHQFVHPTKPGTVTVPHPKKDLGKGLVQAIRKQAGLK